MSSIQYKISKTEQKNPKQEDVTSSHEKGLSTYVNPQIIKMLNY